MSSQKPPFRLYNETVWKSCAHQKPQKIYIIINREMEPSICMNKSISFLYAYFITFSTLLENFLCEMVKFLLFFFSLRYVCIVRYCLFICLILSLFLRAAVISFRVSFRATITSATDLAMYMSRFYVCSCSVRATSSALTVFNFRFVNFLWRTVHECFIVLFILLLMIFFLVFCSLRMRAIDFTTQYKYTIKHKIVFLSRVLAAIIDFSSARGASPVRSLARFLWHRFYDCHLFLFLALLRLNWLEK